MRFFFRKHPIGAFAAALHFTFLLGVLAGKTSELYSLPVSEMDRLTFSSWGAAGVDMIAARAFHFGYEHPLVQALMLVDLPTLLFGGLLILTPLQGVLHPVVVSYLSAAVWLLLGSVQWFVLAVPIDRRLRKHSEGT